MRKLVNGLEYAAILFLFSLLVLALGAVLVLLVSQLSTPLAAALAALASLCLIVGLAIAGLE